MRKLQTLVLLAVFLLGCNSVRKAQNTFDRKPVEAARYCLQKFPPRADTFTEVQTIPGETEVRYVTDTVLVPGKDGEIIRIPCPPARHTVRVDTYYKTRTVWAEDTRKAVILTHQRDSVLKVCTDLSQRNSGLAKARNRNGYIAGAGWLLFLITCTIIYLANRHRL